MKTILIIGTLDTKGIQLGYLKEAIQRRGHNTILMDVSMKERGPYEGDITPEDVLRSTGKDLETLKGLKDRFEITEVMTEGAKKVTLELFSKKAFDGMVAMGGITIAVLASRAMHLFPFGLPKLIAVPAAMPAYINRLFNATDIVISQVIMELAGMNDLVRLSIEQIAGIICGMVESPLTYDSIKLPYPSVAITELGFCTNCARETERILEAKGYNVVSFHAQGISDRAMDKLIGQGFFDGLIDICPAGLIEEQLKGNRAAGFERLDAPIARGMPLVLTPCCLNVTGCGPTRIDREKYASRGRIWKMDALRAMTRLNEEELKLCATLYSEKLNRAVFPIKFVIPLKGFSSIDAPGTILFSPEEDRILIDELKRLVINKNVEFIEVDYNLEDPEFSSIIVDEFEKIFAK